MGFVVRRFTQIAQKALGAVGSQMAGLLAVITNNGVTSVHVVPGLMAMAASARLSFVPEVNQNFSKPHVVGNGTLNSDTVMMDPILNIFPARFTKIATAGTEDITIFRETINDSWIWHFVRSVKNLKIRERSFNILDSKRLVAELDNIFLKKVFFKLSTSERKDDLSGRLALHTRSVGTVYSSIFQSIKNFMCRHTVSGVKRAVNGLDGNSFSWSGT